MTTTVKVTTVGNSVGIVLPKEMLGRLNVQKGDTLFVTETPDGIQLTSYDEKFVRVMEAANQIMRENRDVLRKLAE